MLKLQLMQVWAQKQKGFTIVELLIVVVVIAILAAITIVAYNGIQNRAKGLAVQSAVSQAQKKALVYASENGDVFPESISFRSALSLPAADSDKLTYDYFVSNDRKSFCLSVTDTVASPVISYASTQKGQIVSGRCIMNLSTNPSVESNATGWSSGWSAGSGINATASLPTNGAYAGTTYRSWLIGGANTTNGTALLGSTIDIGSESKITMSYWLRSSISSNIGIIMNRYTEASGAGTNTAVTSNVVASTPLNTWIRRSGVIDTNGFLSIRPGLRANTGTLVAGQVVDADAVMITLGDVDYAYRDGDSPDWVWTGTPHASTSFGPGVPYN